MRDGVLDGMQHFDTVIEKLIRDGVLEMETGLAYSTNAGNLRLSLSDLLDGVEREKPAQPAKPKAPGAPELEIERL
jgi:Tfp pilus assembly ATPase PilU